MYIIHLNILIFIFPYSPVPLMRAVAALIPWLCFLLCKMRVKTITTVTITATDEVVTMLAKSLLN